MLNSDDLDLDLDLDLEEEVVGVADGGKRGGWAVNFGREGAVMIKAGL